MSRILVVEDDHRIAAFIEKGLRAAGCVPVVADTAQEAEALGVAGDVDLVILDMGLPGGDGLQVLRAIRSAGRQMPVIVLTGLTERDATMCLEAGADDYMRKPFAFDELLARIRTRLRDKSSHDGMGIDVGGVHLDLRTRRVRVNGHLVELTNREFVLLEAFMRHPGHVLSREQLLSQVWGYHFDPSTNLVNVYVNALRKKVGGDLIETVRGAGYRFTADPA
ncbi:response regulator transcription factor [Fodinibacter luteus]|uniref:Response regulator transcription factor n=1 Tax=Fodinibacter luteus TaxID=552064 RepID=A0ABP8KNM7_9MICO